jgi:hypothetical protein
MYRPEVMVDSNSALMAMVGGSNIRANLRPVREAFARPPGLPLSATWVSLLPGQKGAVSRAFSVIAIFFTKKEQPFPTALMRNPVIFFTIL